MLTSLKTRRAFPVGRPCGVRRCHGRTGKPLWYSAEKGAAAEFSRLAQKFKYSLDERSESIAELARWIRYTPPPLETKRVAPPFEDQEDENEDDGPGTIH